MMACLSPLLGPGRRALAGQSGTRTPGAAAEWTPDGTPGVRTLCVLLVIDPVIDAASETVRVKRELPNPKHGVAAGARATVTFPQGRADPGPTPAPDRAERRP